MGSVLRRLAQAASVTLAVVPILSLTLFDPPDWMWLIPDPVVDTVGFAPLEMAANVALFLPLGIVLGAWWPRRWQLLGAVAAGSIAIELLQLRLPERVSDPVDVVMNTLGAAIGFLLARQVVLWVSHRRLVSDPDRELG